MRVVAASLMVEASYLHYLLEKILLVPPMVEAVVNLKNSDISHIRLKKKQQVCRPRLLKVGTYLFIVSLSPALCFQFEQIGLPLTHTCPSTAWLLFPKLCVV